MNKNYKDIYTNLLKDFFARIDGVELEGISSIHIPSAGDLYDKAKYKIAFYGIETKGWGELKELKNIFLNNPSQALAWLDEDFKELAFLNWTNNFGNSFWNFILLFLAKFYNINDWKELKNNEDFRYILKTFIWGNTNSLEAYDVTAKSKGVDIKNWELIKKESKILDRPKYIIDSYKPNLLIILNWSENEKWLTDDYKVEGKSIGDHLTYYYIEEKEIDVYWLAHPRWISANQGFENVINSILLDLQERKKIQVGNEILNSEPIQVKENIDKKEYIADLAMFLTKKNMKMSGYELSLHLNRNGIETDYGTSYAGGRGIYTLINSCYKNFDNEKDIEKAKAIANVFVKENGDYAYE